MADLAVWCVGDISTREDGEVGEGWASPGGGISPSYEVANPIDGVEYKPCDEVLRFGVADIYPVPACDIGEGAIFVGNAPPNVYKID